MQKTVEPSSIRGSIKAPASKSVVQRTFAASLLCCSETSVSGYTESEDALAALSIIKTLGATVRSGENLTITGNPPVHKNEKLTLNCGESGLSSRLFAPLSMLYSTDVCLNGTGSLLKRPFGNLMRQTFEQMGVEYHDNAGKLPVNLRGRLSVKKLSIDGSGGSQFISGILMTLPLLDVDSVVEVQNLKSKPYIDLTLNVLSQFGINVISENHEVFRVKAGQRYRSTKFNIEGDWSGASCLLVAGAVAGEITVDNLDYNSTQADKKIVDVLRMSGADVEMGSTYVKVFKNRLKSFDFDATDSPDLFPALVALAVNCEGISRIKGVNRLASKESDRAATLKSEFCKIGANVSTENDCMIVEGCKPKGALINPHNDHRIAMSLAVAALNAESHLVIENPECVNKSYPDFWKDMDKISNRN
ncbi:MAG: 3-phosphoshikimate 1-carboxyvinyltransferase [Prevotellaceae bacterium]|jgi:3-phosphoshikimate 1-carboxyvinyltransferase|nr:3-phosphoshikimate 1-carboxyvinyltransferase [Prevotellaceae bacterium]